MAPTLRYALVLAAALVLGGAGAARSILRISAEGAPSAVLRPVVTEDNTAWYALETWLRALPGETSWDAEQRRLTYREGGHWAALRPEAPYALRDGRPLEGVRAPRFRAGALLVDEGFFRQSASGFLGRPVVAARIGTPRTVVIDPGHGGEDRGAGGPGGAWEKDVVLALARAVADGLRGRGFEVHLTRTGDHGLTPEQRAGVANYWQADLFLSLHVSGLARPRARGFEVFVASVPPAGGDPGLWEGGQVGREAASRRWAENLRRALGEGLATFDRGVGQVPHPVLEAVACPACLVEAGNLAWPQDAELLNGDPGRSALAEAVARAAEAFFAERGQGGAEPEPLRGER
ncbi:MAG: hypothetical protein Kow0092_04480 [Deferrisomatales bacterium]